MLLDTSGLLCLHHKIAPFHVRLTGDDVRGDAKGDMLESLRQ